MCGQAPRPHAKSTAVRLPSEIAGAETQKSKLNANEKIMLQVHRDSG